MISKFYVARLADVICSGHSLDSSQLLFLVDIVCDYLFEYDYDCYNDMYRAKVALDREVASIADDIKEFDI